MARSAKIHDKILWNRMCETVNERRCDDQRKKSEAERREEKENMRNENANQFLSFKLTSCRIYQVAPHITYIAEPNRAG